MSAKRLNPFQHALKRPDVYIGSTRTAPTTTWWYDAHSERIVERTVAYNPGLVRIAIEILSNAIDNKWRSARAGVRMSKIAIATDSETGAISVWNDGAPIPVERQRYEYTDPVTQQITAEEIYPAQLYFGYMLAGTNYDDSEERKTSGRNGMGAKACNVFSTSFVVDHACPQSQKALTLAYADHVTIRRAPKVKAYRRKTGYTKVTFVPDYAYFGYPGLDAAFAGVLEKLAIDTAMITKLKVWFNGAKYEIGSLDRYAAYYGRGPSLGFRTEAGDEAVLADASDGGEGAPDGAPQLAHVSFVNGIYTPEGGAHVKAWQDALVGGFVRRYNLTRDKGEKTTAKEVYPYLRLFVRCEVANPAFSSQTKEFLVSPAPAAAKLDKKGYAKLEKWPFAALLAAKLAAKRKRPEKVAGKRVLGLGSKADDANWAGTKRAAECTLYITEGQSAKTFAVGGIASVRRGHDRYGVFAVKGKFINVTNSAAKAVRENAEVQALVRVLGLEREADYRTAASLARLRYGKVCILADADDDGIHIRGLLLNFFKAEYPTLWQKPGEPFFESMSTPVAEAAGAAPGGATRYFYSLAALAAFRAREPLGAVKYIKGLGTMTGHQARREFAAPRCVAYVADHTAAEAASMRAGFDKGYSEVRKGLICRELARRAGGAEEAAEAAPSSGLLSLSDFVGAELIKYYCTAIARAIPSAFDGLKVSQRKILYGCFRKYPRGGRGEEAAKVARLAGYISGETDYHHGETALQDAIVKMAQGFVGANNIPLLKNEGSFGSRRLGGKDAAAARYIYTKPEPLAALLFPPADAPQLPRALDDAGNEIEPRYYLPVLPLLLVNGAEGVAPGFSTTVPAYDPRALLAWIRAWLAAPEEAAAAAPLVPWYRGFGGEIVCDRAGGRWESRGAATVDKNGGWTVTELPVGVWTDAFKEKLETLASGAKGTRNAITNLQTYCSPNTIRFTFKPKAEGYDPEALQAMLRRVHSLKNMVALDERGVPTRFDSPEAVLEKFCPARLALYEKRRARGLEQLRAELGVAENRCRYIRRVIDGSIKMLQPVAALDANLEAVGLARVGGGFGYLHSMPIQYVTSSAKADELEAAAAALRAKLAALERRNAKELWLADLAAFEAGYAAFLASAPLRDNTEAAEDEGPGQN